MRSAASTADSTEDARAAWLEARDRYLPERTEAEFGAYLAHASNAKKTATK